MTPSTVSRSQVSPATAPASRHGPRGSNRERAQAATATTVTATALASAAATIGADAPHQRDRVARYAPAGAAAASSRTVVATRCGKGRARPPARRREVCSAARAASTPSPSTPRNAGSMCGTIVVSSVRYRRFSTVRSLLIRRSDATASGAPSRSSPDAPATARTVADRSATVTIPGRRVESELTQPTARSTGCQSRTAWSPGSSTSASDTPATTMRQPSGNASTTRRSRVSKARRPSCRAPGSADGSSMCTTVTGQANSSSTPTAGTRGR